MSAAPAAPAGASQRQSNLKEIGRGLPWDVLVIGGGASGLGAAVDAAARGFRTLLLERSDYAQGTSSRSTKLVHGGVRYLEQFNLTLVLDALRERGYMLRNAPHLVHRMNFVVPMYSYGSIGYYGPRPQSLRTSLRQALLRQVRAALGQRDRRAPPHRALRRPQRRHPLPRRPV